jgi:hypothetical protein
MDHYLFIFISAAIWQKFENLDVQLLERYISKGLSGAGDCSGGRKARAEKNSTNTSDASDTFNPSVADLVEVPEASQDMSN